MNRFSVFLIDDSAEDTELTLRTLRGSPHISNIFSFRDAEEALDTLLVHPGNGNFPGLIFLDMNMPRMNGLEFVRRIKAQERTKDIPVAILTSSTELPDIRETMKLGVKHFIAKPIDEEDIENIVTEIGNREN
ncbi:MAG TPA: response regulator [Bacteroidia bacterium]|nr:response regulator [Bacteroidia bacterium]